MSGAAAEAQQARIGLMVRTHSQVKRSKLVDVGLDVIMTREQLQAKVDAMTLEEKKEQFKVALPDQASLAEILPEKTLRDYVVMGLLKQQKVVLQQRANDWELLSADVDKYEDKHLEELWGKLAANEFPPILPETYAR